MDNNFQELDAQSSDRDTALSFPQSMFRVGEFFEKVKEAFYPTGHNALLDKFKHRGGIPHDPVNWFNQGVACEILRPDGNGWQKGKIRVRVLLEFCPEQIEELPESIDSVGENSDSSLDDIRQMINE